MIRQEEIITTRWKAFDGKSFLDSKEAVAYEKEYINIHAKYIVGKRVFFMYENTIHCSPISDILIKDKNGTIEYIFKAMNPYLNVHKTEYEVFTEMEEILNHLKSTFVYN